MLKKHSKKLPLILLTTILIGKALILSGFIFFFSLADISLAAPNTADELAKLLNNLHTMQAKFEHYSTNKNGVQIGEKITGVMMLERPGKFRWEIKQPNRQLIIVNKNKSLIYDADLEQLVKRKMDYSQPGSPAMLLTSPVEKLKRSFSITKLNVPGPGAWFELKPNAKQTGYRWIKMHFVNGQIKNMQIADNLDQKSTINFNDIIFNSSLSSKVFSFTPPPKTDILEE